MPTTRTLQKVVAFLAAIVTTAALAQPLTVEHPDFDVRMSYPPTWIADTIPAEDGSLTLTFTAPGDAGLVVVVLAQIDADLRAELRALGTDAVLDAWEGFAEDVPNARLERVSERAVAGVPSGVVDYVGQGMAGSVITVIGEFAAYTVVSMGADGFIPEVQAGLETILASLTILSNAGAGAAGGQAAAAPAGNPLAPPAGNPLAPAAANPAAPAVPNPAAPAAGNPLAPAASTPPAQTASPAGYVEPFTDTDPQRVLGGVLDVGSDGTWTGTLTGAAYRLTNTAAPDAVRYYYLTSLPDHAGPLAQGTTGVTLGISAGGGSLSAAGLLFDFDPNDGTYLAFALTTTGYAVFQRSASGFELLAMEDLDSLRPDGRNRLELRVDGTTVEVIVNDQFAASLNGQRAFAGGVGLIAVGAGAFEFQDFRHAGP